MGLRETREQLNVKNCVLPNFAFDDANTANITINDVKLSKGRITNAKLNTWRSRIACCSA